MIQNEDMENPAVEDLVPSKLERPEDPLAEAMNFLMPLQNLASDRPLTHLLGFEVYFRKEKPLLMLKVSALSHYAFIEILILITFQCLKRAVKIDNEMCDLHSCVVRFLKYVKDKIPKSDDDAVSKVISLELKKIIHTTDPQAYNEDFLNKHSSSVPHRFQGKSKHNPYDKSKWTNGFLFQLLNRW